MSFNSLYPIKLHNDQVQINPNKKEHSFKGTSRRPSEEPEDMSTNPDGSKKILRPTSRRRPQGDQSAQNNAPAQAPANNQPATNAAPAQTNQQPRPPTAIFTGSGLLSSVLSDVANSNVSVGTLATQNVVRNSSGGSGSIQPSRNGLAAPRNNQRLPRPVNTANTLPLVSLPSNSYANRVAETSGFDEYGRRRDDGDEVDYSDSPLEEEHDDDGNGQRNEGNQNGAERDGGQEDDGEAEDNEEDDQEDEDGEEDEGEEEGYDDDDEEEGECREKDEDKDEELSDDDNPAEEEIQELSARLKKCGEPAFLENEEETHLQRRTRADNAEADKNRRILAKFEAANAKIEENPVRDGSSGMNAQSTARRKGKERAQRSNNASTQAEPPLQSREGQQIQESSQFDQQDGMNGWSVNALGDVVPAAQFEDQDPSAQTNDQDMEDIPGDGFGSFGNDSQQPTSSQLQRSYSLQEILDFSDSSEFARLKEGNPLEQISHQDFITGIAPDVMRLQSDANSRGDMAGRDEDVHMADDEHLNEPATPPVAPTHMDTIGATDVDMVQHDGPTPLGDVPSGSLDCLEGPTIDETNPGQDETMSYHDDPRDVPRPSIEPDAFPRHQSPPREPDTRIGTESPEIPDPEVLQESLPPYRGGEALGIDQLTQDINNIVADFRAADSDVHYTNEATQRIPTVAQQNASPETSAPPAARAPENMDAGITHPDLTSTPPIGSLQLQQQTQPVVEATAAPSAILEADSCTDPPGSDVPESRNITSPNENTPTLQSLQPTHPQEKQQESATPTAGGSGDPDDDLSDDDKDKKSDCGDDRRKIGRSDEGRRRPGETRKKSASDCFKAARTLRVKQKLLIAIKLLSIHDSIPDASLKEATDYAYDASRLSKHEYVDVSLKARCDFYVGFAETVTGEWTDDGRPKPPDSPYMPDDRRATDDCRILRFQKALVAEARYTEKKWAQTWIDEIYRTPYEGTSPPDKGDDDDKNAGGHNDDRLSGSKDSASGDRNHKRPGEQKKRNNQDKFNQNRRTDSDAANAMRVLNAKGCREPRMSPPITSLFTAGSRRAGNWKRLSVSLLGRSFEKSGINQMEEGQSPVRATFR